MSCSMGRDQDRAARFIEGELPEEEHEAFERHFLECPDCLALMQALAELPAVLSEAPAVAAPARRWRPLGLAALTAAAASFAIWLGTRPPDDPGVLRGGAHGVVELLPSAKGSDGALVLAWTPLSGATRYRVTLFSDDGRTIWTREAVVPPARWPDDVARAAGVYHWRVEALAGDAVLGRSRLADVEIAP